jgi:putative ABC transport system permease protein
MRTRAAGASSASHRLRRILMAIEVALALVLLTGAGLMAQTIHRLMTVDPGFRSDHLLTAGLSLPEAKPDLTRRMATVEAILARTRSIPGVVAAGAGLSLPVDGSQWNSTFWPQDKPVPPTHDGLPSAAMVPITGGYLEALGARLIEGRAVDARDTATSPPIAIVNQALAERIWPGQDPLGQHLKQGWPEGPGPWREVVGVVADIKFEGVTERTPLQIYFPMAQDPPSGFALVVRTAVDPESISAPLADGVAAVSRDMPLAAVRTMDRLIGESIARQRMALLVLGVFAAVALALASIGLYGLVSHAVTERRHEIGVRLALGAARGSIVGLVLRGGLTMALAGIVAGVGGSIAVTRVLTGLLFGVTPVDPGTIAGVAALLLAVAAAACALPAYRASRIGIATALRTD